MTIKLLSPCPEDEGNISMANNPAFKPPLIATVATGIPAGICTIEYKESTPSTNKTITEISIVFELTDTISIFLTLILVEYYHHF